MIDNPDILATSYLDNLNPQQRDAVEYLDGPELVIAGAGSGKTRVLAYKIVHLLAKGYEPWRIMALTFTNKAAREMRERVATLVGERVASKLVMGTFHSVFARMLRSNAERIGIKSNYTIYDATDSKNLVKSIIKDLDLDDKIYKPSTVAGEISSAKNSLLSPEDYAADRDIAAHNQATKRYCMPEIYRGYVARCRNANAMDFDDLLYNMNVLLRDNADIRHHYEEMFRYVLVDEYQDTNFAQHMIINMLCKNTRGLCVVGDDAQSIYSFRGANIANILTLERTFSGLKILKLERNYRSSQNIINAAGSLIAANKRQIPKSVYSENGVGAPIDVVRSYSDFEESYLVANRISQIKQSSGDTWSEFAILYRTNAQSRVLEESLRKRGIPYRIYGGLSFYQRKEVKDIVAYLRLALNPADEEAMRRIINFPARGIGDTTVKKLTAAVSASGSASLWEVLLDPDKYDVKINNGTKRKLGDFANIISTLATMNAQGKSAYDILCSVLSLTKIAEQYKHDVTPENVSKLENINELINGVHAFVTEAQEEVADELVGNMAPDSLARYMSEIALATDVDTTDDEEKNAGDSEDKVTLMTIHAAKGLEFGNIFIVGVEDDLLPAAMSKDTIEGIEEERRLLYVAITRAKRYCMLSYATSRFRNGQTVYTHPSPFLRDIKTQYLRMTSSAQLEAEASACSTTMRISSKAPNRFTSQILIKKTINNNHGSPTADTSGTLHTADELTPGMTIEHSRFGRGRIIEVDATNSAGARIKVDFKNIEIKILLLKFARFTIIDN